MRVHPGALKHGVSPEDAVQAADWSQWVEPLDDDDRPLFLPLCPLIGLGCCFIALAYL